jgi:hypothetical protein
MADVDAALTGGSYEVHPSQAPRPRARSSAQAPTQLNARRKEVFGGERAGS